jgi:hypothetical protein
MTLARYRARNSSPPARARFYARSVTATPSPWAVAHLRLRIGDLTLRPTVEADLDALGTLLPADVELDPSIPQPFGLEPTAARAVAIRQEYWRRLGSCTPTAWIL